MAAPLHKRLNITEECLSETLNKMYWGLYMSQSLISKELQCHVTCIEKLFKKYGIEIRTRVESARMVKKKSFKYSKKHLEILNGLIISDIHIEDGAFQSRLSFGFKHKEFADHIIDALSFVPWSRPRADKQTGCWHSKSSFFEECKILRDEWYKDNKKIISSSFKVTKTSLLYWYLGDGMKAKKDSGALLCSESFSEQENLRLCNLINLEGVPCHVTPSNRIRIKGKNGLNLLLNYIGESPVNCYKYKWTKY